MTGELSGYDAVAEARSVRHVLDIHWSRICSRLQTEVGEVEYRTWLKQISIGPVDGDEITLNLPTRFLRDWVRTQYGDRLSALWNAELPAIRRVELQVGRPDPVAEPAGDEAGAA
ncbi:DnaA N-terminal domain-containing protein, partial [Gluconacetobacter sacchari]